MSQTLTPRVKHSEVKRKPLVPGPNSWAQEAEKISVMKGSNSGIATNRSKYEDKPMPPLPPGPEKSPAGPGKSGYIQPATPLTYSSPSSAKTRAVTDPAAAKNIFNAGKVGIVELRQKFSGSRAKTSTDLDIGKHINILPLFIRWPSKMDDLRKSSILHGLFPFPPISNYGPLPERMSLFWL